MRLRRDPEPSPETVRELEALDAALSGEPPAPEHEELRALALALREDRPAPRPEFALDLDLRVREGFARSEVAAEEGGTRLLPQKRLRLPLPRAPLALATAASLFIVATAVLTSGVLEGGGDESGKGSTPSPRRAAPAAGGAAEGEAQSRGSAQGVQGDRAAKEGPAAPASPSPSRSISPTVPAPPGDIAPGAQRRQVERAAEITLSTERDRIEEVADGVIRVTDRHRGFVLSSSVSAGDRARAGATLELRIPSSRLQAAIADLSELGHVRSRTQSTRDITGEFSSPRRQLRDALAERRGLLRQLAAADTPNETAAVRARLRAVNRRIDRSRARLHALRERVAFSTVAVSVEPARGGTSGGDGDWTLGDAVRDALSVLGAVLGAAIVGLAVAVPLAIMAAIAWLAYSAVARRRRERALDTAEARPAAAD